MSVIIKSLLKSLVDKKARTALVLFSIAISAAMIFANGAFSRTVRDRLLTAAVRWGGNSDLFIWPKTAVGAAEWIDPARLAPYQDQFQYAFQYVREKALYMPSLEQMHYFSIIGVDLGEFNQHNPLALSQGSVDDWTGYKVVLGPAYAQQYGLKVGDTMKLELNNQAYDFQVAGISAVKGLFLRDQADGGYLLAPKSTLAQISGGGTNLIFIKLKDPTRRDAVKAGLSQALPDFEVNYSANNVIIQAETQNYVMPFQVSSVVVVFMCVFIIFTAFNLITLEYIPTIGTLRSIGCTRRRINWILILESAAMGAIGGLAGCFLGVLVLQYIKYRFFTGEDAAINSTVLFGANEVLTAVGAAVVITTLSAILPILRLTRTPIKNIILNDFDRKASRRTWWWAAGMALLLACAVVPRFLGTSFTAMIIASVLATLALVGLVPVAPFLTGLLARLIAKIPFFRHEVVLGVRNVRDNASLMNNIQLFSASIAIVAFMASMFNTMGSDLVRAFVDDLKYDVQMVLRHSDQGTLAKIAQVSGVQSVMGAYLTRATVENYGTFMNYVYGIDGPEFFNFMPVQDLDKNQQALATLNDGKNIITSNVMKGKFGLKLGDTLVLQMGGKTFPYKITGFVETNLGIGHIGYISAANYRADMGVTDYDYLYVKGSMPEQAVKNNLLRALGKEVMSITTHAEFTAANADKVVAVFNAINSYCYLALLVGIIGIVNNLVASFIQRKRSFAMLRCVGMSKKGLNRMLVTEAVAMGIFGVVFGIACAVVMSAAIPAAVSVLWGKVTPLLALKEMAMISAAGILAMLAISIVPVMRSEKMSLIETIKYE